MHFFLLQVRVCICMCIFSLDSLKLVIKELSGQPNPPEGGGGGYWQMGYIMCLFIGYGVQAAKSGTGYRESNSWIGRNLGSFV